jgi:hypothetical protein
MKHTALQDRARVQLNESQLRERVDDFEIGNGTLERAWERVPRITVLIVLLAAPSTVTRRSNMADLSNGF